MNRHIINVNRRKLLKRALILGGGATIGTLLPPWARSIAAGVPAPMPTLSGEEIKLVIAHTSISIDGKPARSSLNRPTLIRLSSIASTSSCWPITATCSLI